MGKIVMIKCIELPSANAHLPIPWKLGEKAFFVEDIDNPKNSESFNDQFIRLKRIPSKEIQVEARKHFKFLTLKK